MFTHRRARSLMLLTLLASPAMIPDKARADRPSPPPWDQLLWWLPEDTETIVVTQGPFELTKPAAKPAEDEPKFRDAVQLLAVGPAWHLKDGLLPNELRGQKVLCAVDGSRRFTSPRGLGLMPYQGSHVLRFEAAADEAVRKAFRTCQEKADKTIDLVGEKAAVFTEKHEDDTWSYYLCRPQPGVLICATDQGYLEETLKRLGRKPERRALPADLPEWKQVDVKARVWGVRHYRKESAKTDPSSPLRPPAPANVSDPAAVGFVFWYNADKDKAHARYLSGAKDAVKLVTKVWIRREEHLTPEIRQVEAGVVEIVTSTSEEETGFTFLFVLRMYLGHAVYL